MQRFYYLFPSTFTRNEKFREDRVLLLGFSAHEKFSEMKKIRFFSKKFFVSKWGKWFPSLIEHQTHFLVSQNCFLNFPLKHLGHILKTLCFLSLICSANVRRSRFVSILFLTAQDPPFCTPVELPYIACKKWYISDTICIYLTFQINLSDSGSSCKSGVSCKILAGKDILARQCLKIEKKIPQENVWNIRETSRFQFQRFFFQF